MQGEGGKTRWTVSVMGMRPNVHPSSGEMIRANCTPGTGEEEQYSLPSVPLWSSLLLEAEVLMSRERKLKSLTVQDLVCATIVGPRVLSSSLEAQDKEVFSWLPQGPTSGVFVSSIGPRSWYGLVFLGSEGLDDLSWCSGHCALFLNISWQVSAVLCLPLVVLYIAC